MKAKDWPLPTVEIKCDHCGRHGIYPKVRFVEIVGAETQLSVAKNKIAADCKEPKVTVQNMHAKCRPYYPQDWWPKADQVGQEGRNRPSKSD